MYVAVGDRTMLNPVLCYFLQLIRDCVCCFRVHFFPSSGIRVWFVYTLEIRSVEINRRNVKIAASQS